jgi:hypothetical protein
VVINNIKKSADIFAAVMHLVEVLRLEGLFVLKEGKSFICLGGTRRPIVFVTE